MTKKFKGKTYLDPKYDPAFKELFDSEDAIKDFLNDVLQLADGDKIKSLTFSFDKVLRFRTPKSKKVILDVFITTASGRFLNIEMQKWKQNKYIMISLPNFKKSKEEVCSRLDAWLYLFNHAGTDSEVPDFGSKIIKDALERIRVDKADNKLLARQEKAMKRDEEYKTRLASGVVNAELKVYKALIAAGKITAEDAVQVSGYPKEMFASK